MMDMPVFRAPVQTSKGAQTSPDEALTYSRYHEWVKRLGEETGFVQVLTTYCLRRATGNAINGECWRFELVQAVITQSSIR